MAAPFSEADKWVLIYFMMTITNPGLTFINAAFLGKSINISFPLAIAQVSVQINPWAELITLFKSPTTL